MISVFVFFAYGAAVFLAIALVAWLVLEFPKSGFTLGIDEVPVTDWKRGRNILAIPISGFLFYQYSTWHYENMRDGPWHMLDETENFWSFGVIPAAVQSVGHFFATMWDALVAGIWAGTAYLDMLVPIPAVSAGIMIALAVIGVVAAFILLGEAVVVVASVGAGALVLAPVIAQIAMVALAVVSMIIGLTIFAFVLSGDRLFDNIR